MESKDEDVRLGANKFNERQPLGTAAQSRDYVEPPATPLFDPSEFTSWSFWRAGIAEFFATLLFLYITIQTVMGFKQNVATGTKPESPCPGVGIQGIAWAFGGMIFALVYCTAGISGPTLHSFPSLPSTLSLSHAPASVQISPYLHVCLSVCMTVYLHVCLHFCLSVCMTIYLHACLYE